MRTSKKVTTLLIVFTIILSLLPSYVVHADTKIADINIISETLVTAKQAEAWAKSKGATDTFINLAELYWRYAKDHGNVNPAIAYVQAAKETGYGKFGGVLDESYHNPCGLKTTSGGGDTDPNAHERFNSWDEGVQAHLDHLALYAGASGYPRSNTYDSRHFVTIKGKASTVNSLGGNWAPSTTYGEEVNSLYNDLLKSSGITNNSTSDESDENKGSNNGSNSSGSQIEESAVPKGIEASEPIKQSDNSSTNISSSIGWKYENSSWYYYKSDGSKATGWIKPDNNWYYLYSDGQMATGWLYSGAWYYLKSNGAMSLGWQQLGSKWYYLEGNGAMVNGLKSINDKKYFFDISGAMRVGWFQISGNWYYFNSDGSMLTGWIKPDNNWYYLYSNGTMATGWIKLGSDWYNLKTSGAMSTGWLLYGTDYYYLNPSSGKMMTDTTINGWKIDKDGKRETKDVNPLNPNGTKKLIVIDPGHNFGGDDGAYATHNGVTYSERDLNMQLGVKLKEKLEAKGYQVMLTRSEFDRETLGVTQSLTNRVNMANNFGADFFVSLHHNSADSESANGIETYYSTNKQDDNLGGNYDADRIAKSREIATAVNNSLVSALGATDRGAKSANLFVTRNTNMPSILIEFGFISNPSEAIRCADPAYQDIATQAVADAIASEI